MFFLLFNDDQFISGSNLFYAFYNTYPYPFKKGEEYALYIYNKIISDDEYIIKNCKKLIDSNIPYSEKNVIKKLYDELIKYENRQIFKLYDDYPFKINTGIFKDYYIGKDWQNNVIIYKNNSPIKLEMIKVFSANRRLATNE